MPLPAKVTYVSAVDSYLADLAAAFRALRNDLVHDRPSGQLSMNLEFGLRMDGDYAQPPVPKITLQFYHHYSWESSTITVSGLEFEEVRSELFRRLGRDSNLKRLANQKGSVE